MFGNSKHLLQLVLERVQEKIFNWQRCEATVTRLLHPPWLLWLETREALGVLGQCVGCGHYNITLLLFPLNRQHCRRETGFGNRIIQATWDLIVGAMKEYLDGLVCCNGPSHILVDSKPHSAT